MQYLQNMMAALPVFIMIIMFRLLDNVLGKPPKVRIIEVNKEKDEF